ncbi:MAG: hypothetical protein R2873_13335 [Caldilineaceae bacterium]
MADTGSLASPACAFSRAWVRDIFLMPADRRHPPRLAGVSCYQLDPSLQDFSPHVETWARGHGFDFAAIRREVGAVYDFLHGSLTNAHLEDAGAGSGQVHPLDGFKRFPGVAEWFRLKAALSTSTERVKRDAIHEYGGTDKTSPANAFMTPFSFVTGLDFAAAAAHCVDCAQALHHALVLDRGILGQGAARTTPASTNGCSSPRWSTSSI